MTMLMSRTSLSRKKRITLSLALSTAIFLTGLSPVASQPLSLSAKAKGALDEYLQCLEEAQLDDWARARCALYYLEAEAQLHEQAFETAVKGLNDRQRRKLETSERKWERYRDKCYDPYIPYGTVLGAGELERYKSCLADRDYDRILWLEKHHLTERR